MKQTTKILTLGILFLFAFSMQLSAQKCKYDYDKKDPITGEITKGNKFTISAPNWRMSFDRSGDTYFSELKLFCKGNAREIIRKGDVITFKLANNEIVTITAIDDFLPVANANETGVWSQYDGKYSIDPIVLQKIAENPPIFVRMSIESKVYSEEVSAKNGKKIQEAARCILL